MKKFDHSINMQSCSTSLVIRERDTTILEQLRLKEKQKRFSASRGDPGDQVILTLRRSEDETLDF